MCLTSNLNFGQAGDNEERRCPMGYSEVPISQIVTDCGMLQALTAKPLKALIITHLVGIYDSKTVAQTLHSVLT